MFFGKGRAGMFFGKQIRLPKIKKDIPGKEKTSAFLVDDQEKKGDFRRDPLRLVLRAFKGVCFEGEDQTEQEQKTSKTAQKRPL